MPVGLLGTMSTPASVEDRRANPGDSVSTTLLNISGITVTVFGVDELPSKSTEVACLWLLHPRLQTQECMKPFAVSAIQHWNKRVLGGDSSASLSRRASSDEGAGDNSTYRHNQGSLTGKRGLIAVSFDQRNHGSRQMDPLANEAWRGHGGKNPRHAQDLFSQIHGNAADTSILLDYLPPYLFPDGSLQIVQNLVFGVSLGGHAAWHVLLREPRVTAGIIGIGCPDYVRLMTDRARLSKLADWDADRPSNFIGSKSFPSSLLAVVRRFDPAGLIAGDLRNSDSGESILVTTDHDKETVSKRLDDTLRGKRILSLSGSIDKFIPYKCSKPFLDLLKDATSTYYSYGGIVFQNMIFDQVGHGISADMINEMTRFVAESIEVNIRDVEARQVKT